MQLSQGDLILLVIAGGALIAGGAYYLSWRRRKDIEALAASIGAQYSPDGPEVYVLEGSGIELFRCGRSRGSSNMVRVPLTAGSLSVFDFEYVTGSGKHRQNHAFTVAYIEGSAVKIPSFDLKPEGLIYKLGELVGFKDIDLPAFPVFSDKYRLTGPDEAAVHMFFTPQRAAWFEQNLGLRVQGGPGGLVLFRGEGRLAADKWQSFIEEARAFAAEVLR